MHSTKLESVRRIASVAKVVAVPLVVALWPPMASAQPDREARTRADQAAREQQDRACDREFQLFRQISADTARLPASTKAAYDTIRMRLRTCVDSVDAARKDTSLFGMRTTVDSLAMALFSIPEYHDEGRLPIGGQLLGPMAYIYASPHLGTFTRKAQIFEHGLPGALVAIVSVETNVPIPNTYDDLGLDNGINCIWLRALGPGSNDPFEVWVTTTPTHLACDATAPVARRGPFNVVEVREAAFPNAADYPPVARFTEDMSGRPVLAFKCLAAFCEVRRNHGQAQSRRPRTRPNPVNPNPRHRLRTVKGWHDEQPLAVRRTNGTWASTGIYASIVPDTGILNYDSTAFHDVWVPAANIVIHNTLLSGKYFDWGLRTNNNYVAVKFDVATSRWVVGIFDNYFAAPIPGTTLPRVTWKMRERMLHRDAAVPLTARFRWTLGDEGIWFPCGNSCCRSDGEIF